MREIFQTPVLRYSEEPDRCLKISHFPERKINHGGTENTEQKKGECLTADGHSQESDMSICGSFASIFDKPG
jgi:hypothetical protein